MKIIIEIDTKDKAKIDDDFQDDHKHGIPTDVAWRILQAVHDGAEVENQS